MILKSLYNDNNAYMFFILNSFFYSEFLYKYIHKRIYYNKCVSILINDLRKKNTKRQQEQAAPPAPDHKIKEDPSMHSKGAVQLNSLGCKTPTVETTGFNVITTCKMQL